MLSRYAAFCLILLAALCVVQTSAQTAAPALRIFHDPVSDMTFAYPGEFTPVPSEAPKNETADKTGTQSQCVRSLLTGGVEDKLGSSAFVISRIDAACPGVLKLAQTPDTFTKEQIQRQLKRYGTPTVTQEPYRYSIEERPAAVTLGSAEPDDDSTKGKPVTTYAAKACFLSNIPVHEKKKGNANSSDAVICFDYTTQHKEELMKVLSFTVRFGDGSTHALVPGSAIH